LDKAKDCENKYEWLQAIEYYNKILDLISKENNLSEAIVFYERIGFCYFRSSLQAKKIELNKDRMNLAVKAHEKAVRIAETLNEKNNQSIINHNLGWITFLKAWIETNLFKKKVLLDEWWKLWKKNLQIFNEVDDQKSVGIVYNNLLEFCRVDRFFVVADHSENEKIAEECIQMGEKAIKIFSKENNIYELARAYCNASWYYGFSVHYRLMDKKREEFGKKSVEYSKRAVALSEKTEDAWLIGWSNNSASFSESTYTDNLDLALKYEEEFIKQGEIAKDNYMLSVGTKIKGTYIQYQSTAREDPEKQRHGLNEALNHAEKSKEFSDLSNLHVSRLISRNDVIDNLERLASYETSLETKRNLLLRGIPVAKENLDLAPEGYVYLTRTFRFLSRIYYQLSKTLVQRKEKKKFLIQALDARKKTITLREKFLPLGYIELSRDYAEKTQIQYELAEYEENNEKRFDLLGVAEASINDCLYLLEKIKGSPSQPWIMILAGHHRYQIGRILYQLYSLTKKKNLLYRAIEVFNKAIKNYQTAKHDSNLAESYWYKAKIQKQLGEHLESSTNFERASKTYLRSAKKISKLKDFYLKHSIYMQAWKNIEQAKYYHTREDYQKARTSYEKAGKLHEKLEDWNYLSPNYFAWANMEEAEELSRTENPQKAIENFQNAISYFNKTENNIKSKNIENLDSEEKDLIKKILKASNLRKKYCQARISLEEAKILDRKGEHDLSSMNYNEAAQSIESTIKELESESERKELSLIVVLCQAWQKMAVAEDQASSDYYLEAANLFEKAKDLSSTNRTRLWTLGNSSFCKGLAAKNKFLNTLERSFYSIANKHVNQAADYYSRAGFQNASEYAKATQRLFDAHLYMKNAEGEINPEKRTKYYQIAEQLLAIAAGSFMKAKQPEKTNQVQEILAKVREEKALAISLGKIMQAPFIASSTLSFSAPTPTSESSVGLESLVHANVQANFVVGLKEVKIGESFCLSVEFVNAGREPALLMRVEDFVPRDFVVVKKPEIYRIEETCLNMKGKQLAPLKLVEVKLTLQPSKKGDYRLNPRVIYLDELGQNKSLQLKTLEIKVEEVSLEDRISTGTIELDSLLLGGIPNEYAVALAGPPCDERDRMMKNFLKAGADEGDITFYISKEVVGLEDLLDNRNFILFLCNPRPKAEVPDLPNVYKLQGTDLTNLGIVLAKAYRSIDQNLKHSKRICVGILSDVLVEYGAKTAREWMSELITDLGSKGFTLLAVMDPKEHPTDQATTVLNLFDGEIEVTQTEDPLECKKSIRVKKLRNQDYIKNPICLTNK
jgi:KaiC/GvpD/RAD55 family RecA-like ATPase/tetratricopeptide (TPR) repeat protein